MARKTNIMKRLALLLVVVFTIEGCASFTAENVGKGMELGSLGSGLLGLPVWAAGIILQKVGSVKPKEECYTDEQISDDNKEMIDETSLQENELEKQGGK